MAQEAGRNLVAEACIGLGRAKPQRIGRFC